MKTTKERLLNKLEKKGYTDRVDVDLEISLYEYGIARNPKTNDVVYCLTDGENIMGFDWTTVAVDDVKEAIEEMPEVFFSFIGQSKEEYLDGIDNKYLASYISDMNSYSGHFTQSCDWNLDEEKIINRL